MATGTPFLTPILHPWVSVFFYMASPVALQFWEFNFIYFGGFIRSSCFSDDVSLYSSIVSQHAILCWIWCCSCIMCDSTCCMRSYVSSMISRSIRLILVSQVQCHILLDVERLFFPVTFRYLHSYSLLITFLLHNLCGNRWILCLSENNIMSCHSQRINMQQIVLWFVFQNACFFP